MNSISEIMERLEQFPNRRVRKHIKRLRNLNPRITEEQIVEYLFSRDNQSMREAVVACGYNANEIALGKDRRLRFVLAKNGVYHDALLTDCNWTIRQQMAKNGYTLIAFLNDPEISVRNSARDKIVEILKICFKENSDDFENAIQKYGLSFVELSNTNDSDIIGVMIQNGYRLDFFVRNCPNYFKNHQLPDKIVKQMLNHALPNVRIAGVRQIQKDNSPLWKGLEKDESPRVRAEVASRGHALETLIYDTNQTVKEAVNEWLELVYHQYIYGGVGNLSAYEVQLIQNLMTNHRDELYKIFGLRQIEAFDELPYESDWKQRNACLYRVCAYNNNGTCRFDKVFDRVPRRTKDNCPELVVVKGKDN